MISFIISKRLSFFILCICLLLRQASCFAQIGLNLQGAIDSTLSRNLQIKQVKLTVLLSEENLKQAKLNLLPNLNLNPQSSLNWGRSLDVSTYNFITQRVFLLSGSLGSQVTLFQGGQLRNLIVQNKILLQADKTNLAKVKYDLTLSTATAFIEILTTQELLSAAREQIRLAKIRVEQVKKAADAGRRSLADVAQTLSQLANTEANEASVKNQLEASTLTLKYLMNLLTTDLIIVKPTLNIFADSRMITDTLNLLKGALLANPDIELARVRKDAALQSIKVVKGARFPTLSFYGSIGTNYSDARSLITGVQPTGFDTLGFVSGTNQSVLSPALRTTTSKYSLPRQFSDNFYQSAGLSLQLPLFNRFSAQTNVRKAKISYQDAQLNLQIAENNLARIIGQALADLNAALTLQNIAIINLKATEQVLSISEKRFQAGLLNAIDYNTAISNRNQAEFTLIQARYNWIFKQKVIDFYLGKPLLL